MPGPIDADKRAAIIDDIRADELGCRAIARKHDVSPSTVSLIAQQENIPDAFGRSATKRATEARGADLAAWRADFAQTIADRVQWLESRMDDAQQQVVPTKEGPELVYVELSARDARDYMTAIGIGIDKVGVLTRDHTNGLAAVDSWLRSLTGAETTA